jgi:hypothetical protein
VSEQDAIDDLIKQLVSRGELMDKAFVLRPLSDFKKADDTYYPHEQFKEFLSRIEPTFGYFVAWQLMGSRKYPVNNDPDKPSHIVAALPPKLLLDFEEHLRNSDLLHLEGNAEPVGARQPATRPE